MSSILKIEWTLSWSASPAIMRACARCGIVRPFCTTGKFRLNANGNKLDAWLIYGCSTCGKTWNRPVFERCPAGSLSRRELKSLQSNDPAYACRFALKRLKGEVRCPQPEGGFILTERRSSCPPGAPEKAVLVIRNPDHGRFRLDQVLARGLEMSRKDVLKLAETGVLLVRQATLKAFRRPVPDEVTIGVHRSGEIRTKLLDRLLEAHGRNEPV